jgi:hypothetical protein
LTRFSSAVVSTLTDDQTPLGPNSFNNRPLLTFSYAREWQAKLRELQDSSKAAAVSAAAAAILSKKNDSLSSHLPMISITPSFNNGTKNSRKSPPRKTIHAENGNGNSPIKMDSNGALNLVSTSPSPTGKEFENNKYEQEHKPIQKS